MGKINVFDKIVIQK